MSSKARTFIVVVLVLILLLSAAAVVGGVVLWSFMRGQAPEVAGESVLLCDLRRDLSEAPEETVGDMLGWDAPLKLTEAVRLLHAAADDDRISRVVLRVGGIAGIGWGGAHEIREALLAVRQSGKLIDTYIEATGDLQYYIASASTRIHLSPQGGLAVDGLYAEIQLLKNLFGKVDIAWEAVTAGEFKSFPETYTRDEISDELRRQIDDLLDDRYAEYTEAIALGRSMEGAAVVDAIDDGPYLIAERAIGAGLVDTLQFWSDFERSTGVGPDGDMPVVTLEEYRKAGAISGNKASHTVAVVLVVGDIMPGESRSGIGGVVAGSETVAQAVTAAADDDHVDAIVVRISSPGGSITASEEMWNAIARAATIKPVVASMGDVAASGGYWIATAADVIVAAPTTVTGSIGVFALRPVWNRFLDKIGVGVEEFQRGANADIFFSGKPWSEEHRARIERGILDGYHDFLIRVADGRGLSLTEVEPIAGGRVWTGKKAKEIKLVDELGGIDAALAAAKELAGIDAGEDVHVRYYPEEKSLFEKMRSGEFDLSDIAAREAREILNAHGFEAAGILPYRLEEGALIARLPFRIRE